jgi:hypothetical protein
MLLQHEDHITGKLSFKPEEEIGGTSNTGAPSTLKFAKSKPRGKRQAGHRHRHPELRLKE